MKNPHPDFFNRERICNEKREHPLKMASVFAFQILRDFLSRMRRFTRKITLAKRHFERTR